MLSMRSDSYGCFVSQDRVQLVGARIDGDLTCRGGHFGSRGGIAIAIERAHIGGNVFLSGKQEDALPFIANGDVRLNGSKIQGDVDCSYGSFRAGKECALILVNTDIQGNVQCTDSKFLVQENKSFGGDRMRVGGECHIGEGFFAEGITQLNGARIDGDLNCSDGVFNGGLSAENAIVAGSIFLRNIAGRGEASFASAKVGTLVDDDGLWWPFEVILDGFQYTRIVGDGTPTDSDSRIEWLKRRPKRLPFSPLPYEQAAKVLSEMGYPVNAWNILREKRRLEREHNKTSWSQWIWEGIIDTLTDFVYRPLRTIKWTIGIVLAGTILFGIAGNQGKIVPHQPAILSSSEYQGALNAGILPMEATQQEFPEYPEFNPLAFSLDVFIPLFALHQESFWAPASVDDGDFWKTSFLLALSFVILAIVMPFAWLLKKFTLMAILLGILGTPIFALIATVAAHFLFGAESILWFNDFRWLTVWYWIEILAGWLLSSLLALSVTGLLRPRIGGKD